MANPLPDWVLLRYRVGELPEARQEEIRQRLEIEPDLAARLAAMAAEEASLMERLPPAVVAARAAAPGPTAGRSWWRLALPTALVAVLAAVALITWWPEEPGEVRAKGATPHLRVFRAVPGGMEELRTGDLAAEGDVLQVQYVAYGAGWGAVFSVDGDAVTTVHLPPSGHQAAPLSAEGTVALPASYELDQAPDFERFFLVTSTEPFEIGPLLSAVPGPTAPLEVSPDLEVHSFLVRKPPAAP